MSLAQIDDHARACVFAVERGILRLKLSHGRIELVLEQRIRRNFILCDAARRFPAPDHCFARLRQYGRESIDHRLQRRDIRRRHTISE